MAFSYADLLAPATVRLLSTRHWLWDTVEVTTYLQNVGDVTAYSPTYPSTYTAVAVRIDSLWTVKLHSMASLSAGYFYTFKDTTVVLKGPFAVTTQCDPLWSIETNGGAAINNVLCWDYNFHPTIHYDTVTIVDIDTLWKHDTTRVNIHDTIKTTITNHDTIRTVIHDTTVVRDTIHATFAKRFAPAILSTPVASVIYNVIGQEVWRGVIPLGVVPRVRLPKGTLLLVQGDNRKLLKVNYNTH